MRGLGALLMAAACGTPAPRGVWSKRGSLEPGDRDPVTIRLSDPIRQPTKEIYVANPRHRGPSRGGGCHCRRKQCTLKASNRPAPSWCSVHEAAVKACFLSAGLSGRAVVTMKTNDRGRVEEASVESDDLILQCVYRASHGAAFHERPSALWQVIYEVDPGPAR